MYKNPNYQKNWRENNKEKLKIDRKAYYEKNKINQLEKQVLVLTTKMMRCIIL